MPKAKKIEIPHTIISLNVLATGRMILTTEKRVYELVNNVWEPMIFADDPVAEPDPVVAPVETPATEKSWTDPVPLAGPVYPEPNRGATYP